MKTLLTILVLACIAPAHATRCERLRLRAMTACNLAAKPAPPTSTTTTLDPPACPTTTTLPPCDPCVVQGPLNPSCSSCAGLVCAQDITCCTSAWDALCVSEVGTDCCPGNGPCCP